MAQRSDRLATVQAGWGLIHFSASRHKEATAEFERALALEACHADATNGLAAAWEALGSAREAETAYRRAAELKANC